MKPQRTIKRDNWTNDEVIKLLEGQTLSMREGSTTDEFTENWNFAIRTAASMFEDFKRNTDDPAAKGYCPEEETTYHVGPRLPR